MLYIRKKIKNILINRVRKLAKVLYDSIIRIDIIKRNNILVRRHILPIKKSQSYKSRIKSYAEKFKLLYYNTYIKYERKIILKIIKNIKIQNNEYGGISYVL